MADDGEYSTCVSAGWMKSPCNPRYCGQDSENAPGAGTTATLPSPLTVHVEARGNVSHVRQHFWTRDVKFAIGEATDEQAQKNSRPA